MPKFIFLDTNNWIYLSNGFNVLSNKHEEVYLKIFDIIQKRVDDGSIVFLINDIVIEEWNRNKQQAESQLKAIENKFTTYSHNLDATQEFIGCSKKKIAKLKKILEKKYNEKIQRHREHIKSVEHFLLTKTKKIDVSDGVKIVAANLASDKKAPFIGDKKNSMNDALILLSSLEYIYENEKDEIISFSDEKEYYFPESFFVSSNKGDFSSPQDKEIIHPDLEPYLEKTNTEFYFTLAKLINSLEERFLSEEEEKLIEHDDSFFCEYCGYEYYPTVEYFEYFEIYDPNKHFIDKDQLTLDFPETYVDEISEDMMTPMIRIRRAECSQCGAEYFECECGQLMHIDEYNTRFECTGGCGRYYIVHSYYDHGALESTEIEILEVFYCKNCGKDVESINEFGYCEECEENENRSIND